jgi:cytidylate kinase
MKIITISREFGSGGRELGKRMADILGFDYYDREIIAEIARRQQMDEEYVEKALDHHAWQMVPLTFHQSFAGGAVVQTAQTSLLLEQKKVLEGIAKLGHDCIIVGRNADILLKDHAPLNLFVCADMEAKIRRCRERASQDEKLTDRQIERNVREIDRSRARTRDMLTDCRWGDRANYHLIVNTTDWSIKSLAPVIAGFCQQYFHEKE